MAIIVDPDNLDRAQVIYGTTPTDVSLRDVGSLVDAASEGAGGSTIINTTTFQASGALFQTWGLVQGDILCLFTGANARHFVINTVISEVELTVDTDDTFATFSESASGLDWATRDPSGGSIVDGVTEQCVYSYSKEEWRTDTENFGGDDLIRHPFPFEPITSKQFEIGGLAAHGDWDYANLYTRNEIRTGGWRSVNLAGTAQQEYSGMISLGAMDDDAQAYYQQIDATTAPADFAFTGTLNEAVFVWELADDRRTYFKAFLRKKGKTYAQYDLLTEQGISALTYEVYSFPLTHSTDAAISDDDGEIVSQSPYTTTAIRTLAGAKNDGVTGAGGATFTSATAQFQTSDVQPGDALRITAGANTGYYHILSVDTELQVTVSVADGTFSAAAAQTFDVYTSYLIDPIADDGTLATVGGGDTGTLTSIAGGFIAAGIDTGDMLVITEAASDHRGVYKVISRDADDILTLNTEDKAFTAVGNIDYYILEPSMRLQYKWETITLAGTGDLTFNDNDPNPDSIDRAAGSWAADGVLVGDVIIITGSANNNGSYTVATVGAGSVTLVATDTLTNEGAVAATALCRRGFTRVINTVTYAFAWRLFGNNASAEDCYQYTQHQLRQTTDIDHGPGVARGDITDQMYVFATPTGTTTDMHIDDIHPDDTNNVTYYDATGVARTYPYVASGSIEFNINLQGDAFAIYRMFFLNDDTGDDTGRDYGTSAAITVQDAFAVDVAGNVGGAASTSFTYDYDGNTQRGLASIGTVAPIVIVGIGLGTAQFVRFDGNITRSKGLTFALVSALERNYSNP